MPKLIAFAAGALTVGITMGSPLAHLDHQLLIAHMVQHLLLMTVAAPLILWGAAERLSFRLHPAICWLAGTGVVLFWHVPGPFEWGMRSGHLIEQSSFLIAGLLFWQPVMHHVNWSPWMAPLYLFLATVPCDALSAFLTFCDRVVYSSYAAGHSRLAPLEDQQWAGTIMWVWVTFAYMAPAVWITIQLLSPPRPHWEDYSRG